jgi:hypothetical protein
LLGVIGVLLIGVGLASSAWGIWTATTRARPASLAGSIIAAVGLALAFAGAVLLLGARGAIR